MTYDDMLRAEFDDVAAEAVEDAVATLCDLDRAERARLRAARKVAAAQRVLHRAQQRERLLALRAGRGRLPLALVS